MSGLKSLNLLDLADLFIVLILVRLEMQFKYMLSKDVDRSIWMWVIYVGKRY